MKCEQQGNGRGGHNHIIREPRPRNGTPVSRDRHNFADCDPEADRHHHLEQGDCGEKIDDTIDAHTQSLPSDRSRRKMGPRARGFDQDQTARSGKLDTFEFVT